MFPISSFSPFLSLSFVAVGRRSCEHQKSDLHASSLTGIATRRYHVDCRVDGSSHRIFSSFLVKYQNITLVSEPQRFQKKYCVFCCCSLDSILWIEFFFFDWTCDKYVCDSLKLVIILSTQWTFDHERKNSSNQS